MSKKTQKHIEISERSMEPVTLVNKFPVFNQLFEDSVLRNRQRGQLPEELSALIAADFEAVRREAVALSEQLKKCNDMSVWRHYIADKPPSADAIGFLILLHENEATLRVHEKQSKKLSENGKKAADDRHKKPGGSHEKMAAIRALWASGNYSSRNLCAEEECAGIGLSYFKARAHLIGTPDNPSPKPT